MLEKHIAVFLDVARLCTCCIGLREPNRLSENWIGKKGYRPKSEKCKAKTADNEYHRFGGLVVDPTLCRDAFKDALSAEKATAIWKKDFLLGGKAFPPGFSSVEHGLERGLVRHNGDFIFADYDLMTLVRSDDDGKLLPTTNEEEKVLFNRVRTMLNDMLGIEMIQHGAEFMWKDGIGAKDSENIYWFRPGRTTFECGLSSIQDPEEIAAKQKRYSRLN